jgi:hypothetical protein
MSKQFLTHHFAVGFEGLCQSIDWAGGRPHHHELVRLARLVGVYFERSIRAESASDRAAQLFVALTYLKDCGEIIEKSLLERETLQYDDEFRKVRSHFRILQGRLERLFWESGDSESGQLRMLG